MKTDGLLNFCGCCGAAVFTGYEWREEEQVYTPEQVNEAGEVQLARSRRMPARWVPMFLDRAEGGAPILFCPSCRGELRELWTPLDVHRKSCALMLQTRPAMDAELFRVVNALVESGEEFSHVATLFDRTAEELVGEIVKFSEETI